MASSITLTGPTTFWGQDAYETVLEELYAASDTLGKIEQFNVSARTPVLTGALQSSISYEPMKSPHDKVLAFIYADTTPQEDEWGRVYDLYIEGGSGGFGVANMGLGLGSNAGNGNREMFGRMFTDDLSAIEQWGEDALNNATSRLASGKGVPFP